MFAHHLEEHYTGRRGAEKKQPVKLLTNGTDSADLKNLRFHQLKEDFIVIYIPAAPIEQRI